MHERFREVVLPHLGDALALARWLTNNTHDAEDVVQEACLKAFTGLGSYAGGSARAWLLAIVRNTSLTWLARHRRKATTEIDDMAETIPDTSSPGPDAEMIAKADAERLEAAIAALPQPAREVIVLRDVNGLSYREIAAIAGIPVGTVMSRLARARAMLIAEIGQPP